MRICVLDDWQRVAQGCADWGALQGRAELVFYHDPLGSEDEAAAALAGFDVIMAMRERTAFPASLVARLPNLKLFSLTGRRARSVDMAAMAAQGVTVCGTGGSDSGGATAELALGLMLAAARGLARGDAAVRAGRFQSGTAPGMDLEGKVLGLIGLGRIGQRMARYGAALGMPVLAWSPNLTAERAVLAGATLAAKHDLLARADVVSLHMVLSDSTVGLLDAKALGHMKDGAILVNTARGPLVDEAALVAELRRGRLVAALDVFDREPLPPGHPLLSLPNTVLSPHLGYSTLDTYREFYRQSIANVVAFLEGKPQNVVLAGATAG
jgi:phosphoglycerate dehydrogenase-like enzyme